MSDPEYTAEEANKLLPELSASLRRIRSARQVVLSGGKRLKRGAALDGGGPLDKEYRQALSLLRREVQWMTDLGIVLRDPERGLVDFPSRLNGRDAFLCWKVGEERVGYWHGPDSGYAGRRPL